METWWKRFRLTGLRTSLVWAPPCDACLSLHIPQEEALVEEITYKLCETSVRHFLSRWGRASQYDSLQRERNQGDGRGWEAYRQCGQIDGHRRSLWRQTCRVASELRKFLCDAMWNRGMNDLESGRSATAPHDLERWTMTTDRSSLMTTTGVSST